MHRLGRSPTYAKFVIRLPLPGNVGRGTVVSVVSPTGSTSNVRPCGLNRLILRIHNSVSAPLPYAPHNILRLLSTCSVSLGNGRIYILNHNVAVNHAVNLVLAHGTIGTAIALYRANAQSITSRVHHTSIVITTVNSTKFIAPSGVGSNTILISINIDHICSRRTNHCHVGNSISGTYCSGTSTCAPGPKNINPVAQTVLLTGIIRVTRQRT